MEAKTTGQRLIAEINLDHIVFNYRQACKCAPGSQVCCVIKANAYGHGAVPVARALAKAGATHFAVATPEEALQLRRHGIQQDILLLGPVDCSWVRPLAEQGITLTIASSQEAKEYAAVAGSLKLKIHIKLETGLARLGFSDDSAVEDILALAADPHLELEGLFTHFAAADDELENDFTNQQMARFQAINEGLQRRGLIIPQLHCAASAAIIGHPHTHVAMVCPGIMLYGSNPTGSHPLPLKPALSLKARVVQVSKVEQGKSVSYGRTWFAPRDSLIATLSIGYADGLTRFLSGRLPMLVRGQAAWQVGRICMDMCMLDVTDIPGVKVGDYATIIGQDGELCLTADQVAAASKTISYEVLCAVGLRVTRQYYENGQLIEQINYLDQI